MQIEVKFFVDHRDLPALQEFAAHLDRAEQARWDTPDPAPLAVPANEKVTSPEPSPEPAQEQVSNTPPTEEEVTEALSQLVALLGVPGTRAFLNERFGVSRISELDVANRTAFIDAVRATRAEANA